MTTWERARRVATLRSAHHDRWGLILAGGDGTRLQRLTRRIAGDDRPKQFCRLLGDETLLAGTRRRTALLIPPERILILVTRCHEKFYAPLLEAAAPGCFVRQPQNRGTAPAILYGLLRIAAAAPMDAVGIFPSDHYVSDNAAFMAHVAEAFEIVRARPELIVMLGIDADAPETAYGWIAPGAAIPTVPWRGLFRVHRFWEKPPPALAESLLASWALWNSFVIVARVSALLGMMKQAVPALFHAFDAARPVVDSDGDAQTFEALYADISSTDFSQHILAPHASSLAVLKVSGVAWDDLGDARRVLAVRTRVGIDPERAGPVANVPASAPSARQRLACLQP